MADRAKPGGDLPPRDEQKLREDREIIDRAKRLLVQQLCMTEPEAHRYIARQAMDTCRTRRVIAENIIRTYELSYVERWNLE